MEEDDDITNSWNLWKCSDVGMDILSTIFGDEILPILMFKYFLCLVVCGTRVVAKCHIMLHCRL